MLILGVPFIFVTLFQDTPLFYISLQTARFVPADDPYLQMISRFSKMVIYKTSIFQTRHPEAYLKSSTGPSERLHQAACTELTDTQGTARTHPRNPHYPHVHYQSIRRPTAVSAPRLQIKPRVPWSSDYDSSTTRWTTHSKTMRPISGGRSQNFPHPRSS